MSAAGSQLEGLISMVLGLELPGATSSKVTTLRTRLLADLISLGLTGGGSTPSYSLQVFTASGNYNPPAGLSSALIFVQGAGGGGGGLTSGGVNVFCVSSGGGGGGCSISLLSAATIGALQVVTIGAGGIAGSVVPTNGGNGGDSSFGALIIGKGGSGGTLRAGSATGNLTVDRGLGGIAGTGNIKLVGGDGGTPIASQSGAAGGALGHGNGGFGGSSFFSNPQPGPILININASSNVNGLNGKLYGGGATGAACISGDGPNSGGVGAAGIVIVFELNLI